MPFWRMNLKKNVQHYRDAWKKHFGTDHLLYLAGDKEDVENAKKAGKSLGIYLAEQILAGENFHKVVNEARKKKYWNCWKRILAL